MHKSEIFKFIMYVGFGFIIGVICKFFGIPFLFTLLIIVCILTTKMIVEQRFKVDKPHE